MSCPEKEPLTTKEKAAKTAEMARSLNVQSCNRKDRGIDASMSAEIDAWVASAKTSAEFRVTDSSSIGCEQIAIMSNEMNQASDAVSCILSRSESSSDAVVSANNTIRIEAEGVGSEIVIDCGDEEFQINQTITLKVVKLDELTDNEQNQIEKTIDNAIHQSAQSIQDSVQGRFAGTAAQKSIIEQCTNIQNKSYNLQTRETIKKLSLTVNTKNDISIIAKGGARISVSGRRCRMDQNIIVDVLAQSIVQNTMKTAFKDLFTTIVKSDTTTEQSGKVAGTINPFEQPSWAKVVGAIFMFIFLGGIFYIVFTTSVGIRKKKTKKSKDEDDEDDEEGEEEKREKKQKETQTKND